MSILIYGLPNDITIMCLARVPFYLYPKLEAVSRAWRQTIRSPELFKTREELNSTDDLLCICAAIPKNLLQLYDPLRDLWITLPLFPSRFGRLTNFGVVSVLGKIFMIGGQTNVMIPSKGYDMTSEVWCYDIITRIWTAKAPMLVRRGMFACCVSNGKIVVAGGYTCGTEATLKAEIYDPKNDVWSPLPDLNHTSNTSCSGLVIDGKVHVFYKFVPNVQILDNDKLEWDILEYAEWVYGSIIAVRGSVYNLIRGILYKHEKYERKPIVYNPAFEKRVLFGIIELREELYVIGGLFWQHNPDLTPQFFHDVHVLTIGSENPTWRQMASMTKCTGILGCTNLKS